MRALIAGLAIMLGADCALANWVFDEKEDAFNGNKYSVISLDLAGYALAFKCTNASDLSIAFLTPERAEQSVLDGMQSIPMQLITIVDKGERVAFDATVDESQAVGTYLFESDADGVLAFAKAASVAKQRVAIAVSSEILDKPIHARTFGTKGLTKALQRLSDKCQLP